MKRNLLEEAMASVEKELIVAALRESRGNQAQAAKALGITERIMGLRVCKYGIEARAYRRPGDGPPP